MTLATSPQGGGTQGSMASSTDAGKHPRSVGDTGISVLPGGESDGGLRKRIAGRLLVSVEETIDPGGSSPLWGGAARVIPPNRTYEEESK